MLNLEYVGITVEQEMLVALRGTQENSLSRPDLTLRRTQLNDDARMNCVRNFMNYYRSESQVQRASECPTLCPRTIDLHLPHHFDHR
ncbi:hypothetical protein J6590_031154 [Homalodisca vitripennis]|nr:hypothetical protein J6590_031154 [Homalodisca vitripennis]